MPQKITLKGRGLVDGCVEGEALVSQDSLVWSHGVEPATGRINDVRVALCGTCVKDKILVYPYGKGSTSGATWMLDTTRNNNAPRAILNRETELIIVTGAVLSDTMYNHTMPVVDRFDLDPLSVIETGDWVKVDGATGVVEVYKGGKPE